MKGEESSSKAEQGSKTKEAEHPISRCQNFRTPDFKVRKFRTPQNQGAKSLGQNKSISHTPTSRCEIHFQGANFLKSNFAHHCGRCENFRTVRNHLQAHVCQFRTPQAHFRTVRNGVRKFRTPLFKMRKFRTPHFKVRILLSKGGNFRTPKFKVRKFQFKVRKFRTVKFSALKI